MCKPPKSTSLSNCKNKRIKPSCSRFESSSDKCDEETNHPPIIPHPRPLDTDRHPLSYYNYKTNISCDEAETYVFDERPTRQSPIPRKKTATAPATERTHQVLGTKRRPDFDLIANIRNKKQRVTEDDRTTTTAPAIERVHQVVVTKRRPVYDLLAKVLSKRQRIAEDENPLSRKQTTTEPDTNPTQQPQGTKRRYLSDLLSKIRIKKQMVAQDDGMRTVPCQIIRFRPNENDVNWSFSPDAARNVPCRIRLRPPENDSQVDVRLSSEVPCRIRLRPPENYSNIDESVEVSWKVPCCVRLRPPESNADTASRTNGPGGVTKKLPCGLRMRPARNDPAADSCTNTPTRLTWKIPCCVRLRPPENDDEHESGEPLKNDGTC